MSRLPRSTQVVVRVIDAAFSQNRVPTSINISRASDLHILLQFVFDELNPIFNVAWGYQLLGGLEAGS